LGCGSKNIEKHILDRIQAMVRKYHIMQVMIYLDQRSPILDEANGGRLFTETLTAEVKTVLADKTSLVSAETALTRALSVFSGAREPNGVVGHFWSLRKAFTAAEK